MDFQPYIPGMKPADPGPLSRFLPALEEGVISAWLGQQPFDTAQGGHSNWLLDPFGFSPRLVLEAARSGYRVLVTANNPVTRFLLETFANPPAQSEFTAALADLGAVKKGDERLAGHLQSLYLTTCEKCEQKIQAQAFLWRKGADAPYARIYECPHCGDAGEKPATEADVERAKKIAETDALHRSRAFEKVVSLHDEDRIYAEEAISHYLPRPLYALTTIINRLDNLNLNPERKRALTALLLVAFDAGNTLWAAQRPAERPRPKQLIKPSQFREHNVWLSLERGLTLWLETGSRVVCEAWPRKIPEGGGILIYEGKLKDLAQVVKKEIPIAAVIGSVPRPNQAFWTLSALWAGWLWGRGAMEPYKVALRRRRYDWAWNATALHASFKRLRELMPEGAPFFALLPEPEPPFLTSAFTAASAAGFSLQSMAVRTEHDPVQVTWKNMPPAKPGAEANETLLRATIHDFLVERGEPASYFHVHAAGLVALTEAGILKQAGDEFDEALRKINAQFESALKGDGHLVHYSSGESVETGMWGLSPSTAAPSTIAQGENNGSLADRVEVEIVNSLQKNPSVLYLEIEAMLNPLFPGLHTPSKGLIYAVLNSYAEKDGGSWNLRVEDRSAVRRAELQSVYALIEQVGRRLGYVTRREDKTLHWEENGLTARTFQVMASALLKRALQSATPAQRTILVIPGGRAALAAYKQERDPSLAAQMKKHRLVKYRLLRSLPDLPILTRETFEEQIASDPVEKSAGQMMMF